VDWRMYDFMVDRIINTTHIYPTSFIKMSVRTCGQCIALAKNGRRCKKRSAMTPYCWVHLQAIEHIRIKPSHVPDGGLGLYSTVPIPKGRTICRYGGERVENHDPDYGGDYVLTLKNTDPYIYMNAEKSNKRMGGWANNPPRGRAANASFKALPDLSDGKLIAKRPIGVGTEILVNYGSEYWNHGNDQRAPLVRPPPRKRLSDDEAAERLEEVEAQLPEGILLQLRAYKRRRATEQRAVAVLSDAWRAREVHRQLEEASAALRLYQSRQQ
jgi:hypothetical protein